MTSTASPILRLELMGSGDQPGSWGSTTNTNLGTLLEAAVAGVSNVSVTSANQALTAVNYATDESRMAILILTTTTTAEFAVYAPGNNTLFPSPLSKTYAVYNNTAYNATIYNSTSTGNTTAAGTGVTLVADEKAYVFSDGKNFYKAAPSSLSLSLGTAAAPSLSFVSDANTGVYSPGADQISITTGGTARVSVDASGFVGINRTTPSTYLDVAGPAGVTSFTGTTRLGVTVRGSTAITDYSGIDFIGSSTANPTARIGVLSATGGSSMIFGTSNNYTNGITNTALRIDESGNVGVNTAGPASYGKLVTYNADNNNGFVVVADTAIIRMKGYQTSGTSAFIESTTTNQASYQPMTLGGSTVALATGGVNRLSIDGSGNATFTGSVQANGGFSGGQNVSAGANYQGFVSTGGNDFYNATTNVKMLEVRVLCSGTVRVQWRMEVTSTGNAKVYKNGSPVGSLRSTSGVFTDDVSVSPGDLIQLWGYANNAYDTLQVWGFRFGTASWPLGLLTTGQVFDGSGSLLVPANLVIGFTP